MTYQPPSPKGTEDPVASASPPPEASFRDLGSSLRWGIGVGLFMWALIGLIIWWYL